MDTFINIWHTGHNKNKAELYNLGSIGLIVIQSSRAQRRFPAVVVGEAWDRRS